jgi:arylsulfatase A-like enzyme
VAILPMPNALVAAAMICSACLVPDIRGNAQSPPNLLLVVADDLGVDGVGCYARAAAPPPTPNLDALAAGGVRFTRAYVDPVCTATRAAILTGRHGFRTGFVHSLWLNQPGLTLADPTYAAVLQSHGYATALIGKWHVGTTYGLATPNTLGFQHFAGAIEGAIPDYFDWPRVVNGSMARCQTYATTQEVDDALAWIGAQSGPWALMLCFHAAHAPFQAPPPALHTRNLAGLDPLTNPVPFYAATIEAMDTELGRLLAGIGPAVPADTNVLFVGDNGTPPEVTEPPFAPAHAKNTVYEGGVVVPWIVAGPAVQSPGKVCDGIVMAVDLLPTICELCGVRASSMPAGAQDGASFVQLLTDAPLPGRTTAYAELSTFSYRAITAIEQRFKLILTRGSTIGEELYDLDADPFEQNDLLQQPLGVEASAAWVRLQAYLAQLRPPGSLQPFGTGCAGGAGEPRLVAMIPPQVGLCAGVRIDVSPTAMLVFGMFGYSNTSSRGNPLPMNMASYGMPACELLLDPLYLGYAGFRGGPWSVPVSRNPVVAGTRFYLQAFVYEPGINAGNMVASAGLEGLIGP